MVVLKNKIKQLHELTFKNRCHLVLQNLSTVSKTNRRSSGSTSFVLVVGVVANQHVFILLLRFLGKNLFCHSET